MDNLLAIRCHKLNIILAGGHIFLILSPSLAVSVSVTPMYAALFASWQVALLGMYDKVVVFIIIILYG